MHNTLVILDFNDVLYSKEERRLLPGALRLVRELSSRHTVGIFTSNPRWMMMKMQEKDCIPPGVSFIMDRSFTKPDPSKRNGTFKELDAVFAEFPQFGLHNTIIIDDCPRKMRYNPRPNVIIYHKGDSLEYLSEDIECKMRRLPSLVPSI